MTHAVTSNKRRQEAKAGVRNALNVVLQGQCLTPDLQILLRPPARVVADARMVSFRFFAILYRSWTWRGCWPRKATHNHARQMAQTSQTSHISTPSSTRAYASCRPLLQEPCGKCSTTRSSMATGCQKARTSFYRPGASTDRELSGVTTRKSGGRSDGWRAAQSTPPERTLCRATRAGYPSATAGKTASGSTWRRCAAALCVRVTCVAHAVVVWGATLHTSVVLLGVLQKPYQ